MTSVIFDFQDEIKRNRFYSFRRRDEDAYQKSFVEIFKLLIPIFCAGNDKKIEILVLGPGAGKTDVIPLLRAATELGIVDKIHIVLVDKKNIPTELDSILTGSKVFFSTVEQEIAEWYRHGGEASYNLIVALQVVQHFPDWKSLVARIHNRLNAGGMFIFDRMDSVFLQAIQGQDETPSASKFRNNCSGYAKAAIHCYRMREYLTGIFWDPDVAANKLEHLKDALELFGLSQLDIGEEITVAAKSLIPISKDDVVIACNNREFGPLAWGAPLKDKVSDMLEFGKNVLDEGIPNLFKDEDVKCQLLCYQKAEKKFSNQEVQYSFGENIDTSLRAFQKLDKHLRHDATAGNEENIIDRYIQTLMQCMLFSGVVNDGVAFILPAFGHINNESKVKISETQAILVREDRFNEVQDGLGNLVSKIKCKNKPPFSEYLLNTLRHMVHFRLEKSLDNEVMVMLDKHNLCGPTLIVRLPTVSNTYNHYHNHEVDVEHGGEGVKIIGRRKFQQYIYGDFNYQSSINSPSNNTTWQSSLVKQLKNVLYGINDKEALEVAFYLSSYAHFLNEYTISIYGFYQVYPRREYPEISREISGVGIVVIGEVLDEKEMNYPEIRDAQRKLVYFMCRDMASAVFFHEVGGLSEQNTRLKKFEAMMSLLQEPLDNLTMMLNETQQDTQKLRAILYDPHHAIFAAAPSVMRFFEQSGTVKFGTINMKSVHSGTDPKFEIDDNGIKLVAAIVCKIFGAKEDEITTANGEDYLFTEAKRLLNGDSTTGELAKLCRDLIGGNVFKNKNISEYVTPFNRLKDVLFTPYKDGDKNKPMWALLMTIYGHQESVKITVNSFMHDKLDAWHDSNFDGECARFLSGLDLPVPRYSSLLSLISGVIAYAGHGKLKEVKIVSVPNTKFNITLEFEAEIFNAEMPTTFDEMEKIIRDKKRPIFVGNGNFQKPFYDFSEMCIGQCIPANESSSLKLAYSGGNGKKYTARLSCNGNKFLFEINTNL
ncbi:MAG: methyltransferase domain-containing protein [Pseudobdellovibrionaceae bacterium]